MDIASRSPVLQGYSELVAEVNRNRDTMELSEAIEVAIKTCISRNILVSFLERNGSEVEGMLLREWNQEEAIEVAKEEAREEYRSEILDFIKKGYSLTDIEKVLAKQET